MKEISMIAQHERVEFFKDFNDRVFEGIDITKPDTIDSVVFKVKIFFNIFF